ncbi:MAG: hypothetical protein US02_C0015G0014 [Candidatus Levybacteria bacterium GW2011_GWA2_36_13]|nr:MAG: hypothetical protein US02_C0015G0014 [Candidatus Levybacteria bacterium GW2011_GWA2_36_13]
MKKKNSKLKFPNISRRIPETIKRNKFIILALFLIFFFVALVTIDLTRNLIQRNNEITKMQKLTDQRIYWQKIINTYPDFRDAYFSLAIIEYQLGNFEESSKYLEKVYEIDPNFEKGDFLKEKLNLN